MAPRQSELPEGTDHIINGAMETRRDETPTGDRASERANDSGGFVGSGAEETDDTGGTAVIENDGRASGVRGQLNEGIASLKQQAGGRIREFADDGKTRASDALDEFSRIVEEAAVSLEERLGGQYGPYAHKAAEAVSGFATTLRQRDVDELYDDARGFVRKSPAVAIGVAAALGFVAVRLIKAGLPADEQGETAGKAKGGARKGRKSAGSSPGADG